MSYYHSDTCKKKERKKERGEGERSEWGKEIKIKEEEEEACRTGTLKERQRDEGAGERETVREGAIKRERGRRTHSLQFQPMALQEVTMAGDKQSSGDLPSSARRSEAAEQQQQQQWFATVVWLQAAFNLWPAF